MELRHKSPELLEQIDEALSLPTFMATENMAGSARGIQEASTSRLLRSCISIANAFTSPDNTSASYQQRGHT